MNIQQAKVTVEPSVESRDTVVLTAEPKVQGLGLNLLP